MSRGIRASAVGKLALGPYGKTNLYVVTETFTNLVRKDHFEGQLAIRQTDKGKIGVTLNANIRIKDLHLTLHDSMRVMPQYWVRYASK